MKKLSYKTATVIGITLLCALLCMYMAKYGFTSVLITAAVSLALI